MPAHLTSLPWPPALSIAVFALAGALTVVGSIRLVTLGDTLADRTGWGEAFFGAVFFGLATSLSGIVMTAVTAASAQPELGYSNAVGGIAAQTTAVAVADAFHRRANLEHVAASLSNVLFGVLLIALLALALLGSFAPAGTVAGLHPVSVAMVACYLGGLHLIRRSGVSPLWEAVATTETLPDVPHAHGGLDRRSPAWLWSRFAAVGLVVAAGGWLIALAAESLVATTGLRSGFVGAILMGAVNALPETVTAVAAVRRGAPTLAIAAVLGGNGLDALNLVVADVAHRGGSIYHVAGREELFVTTSALFMTAILLGGLLVRQACGWGRLGFEGVLLLASYTAMTLALAL
ncbi:sodium:calcium antiporter [Micromonospora endolithica]|uniref:Cation transporter n=1 Tax=Micromonospora endolithica TaxID=230091 RepID=A0A3A9YU81_9ACTN|nr:cation transporter [Micromonospora endolithica]RKN39603.1 cation transporter [Micromonospora endolithica]TWJ22260.1 cation:H+ antiporter [Micromonospora endolithica]